MQRRRRSLMGRYVMRRSMVVLIPTGLVGTEQLRSPALLSSYEGEHAITIDPTPLVPQPWWQVPGITPRSGLD